MASSSSDHLRRTWVYQVFVSFRGEDVRKNFVAHLYKALTSKGIYAFKDEEKLSKGKRISSYLREAIEASRISVVVLSENFASSTWCLDELEIIIESREKLGRIVVPIFYNVDPSDVRKHRSKFGEPFAEHEKNFDSAKVERWRKALTEVSSISGWDITNSDEAKCIENIVRDISDKMSCARSSDASYLVGMEDHVSEMDKRLDIDNNAVHMIGIWGMAGIGKTTVARVIYDRISRYFEACCFLENIKDKYRIYGPVAVQEELLSQLLCERNINTWSLGVDTNLIKDRLHFKKVLIVLDGVDLHVHLKALAKRPEWFGPGSRIIITTQNKHLLVEHGVTAIYEAKYLENNQAVLLFCQHAFKQNQPKKEYLELSNGFVAHAKGLPVALKILGSFLYDKSTNEWQSELLKLKSFPNMEIQNVLKLSYESLGDPEKDVFLDIACFFNGEDKDMVTKILDGCDFYPDSAFRTLRDKALITISDNKIFVHELLRDMAREIVRQESTRDPGQRSRLWTPEDICRVLRNHVGARKVEGIFLDMAEVKEMSLDAGAFRSMDNLRLLKFYDLTSDHSFNVRLPDEGLEYLSDRLRYLHWFACPLKALPIGFCPEKLVGLNMPYSSVKQLWKGKQHLVNIKWMDLSDCSNLSEIPDLSNAEKLESLNLRGCINLVEVSSIQNLTKLQFLNLEGCENIKCLPNVVNLKLLRVINLANCPHIKKLPNSIGQLQSLATLNLSNCINLKNLPVTIFCLKSLASLNISGCSNLFKLASGTGVEDLEEKLMSCRTNRRKILAYSPAIAVPTLAMARIQRLSLEDTPSLVDAWLVCFLTNILTLEIKNCKNLRKLPNMIGLKRLKTVDLSGCSSLRILPELPENVECLNLAGTAIEKLPLSIGFLSSLVTLDVRECRKLRHLPSTVTMLESLKTVDISGCANLLKLVSGLEIE